MTAIFQESRKKRQKWNNRANVEKTAERRPYNKGKDYRRYEKKGERTEGNRGERRRENYSYLHVCEKLDYWCWRRCRSAVLYLGPSHDWTPNSSNRPHLRISSDTLLPSSPPLPLLPLFASSQRVDGRCETMCVTGEQILDVRLTSARITLCRVNIARYTQGGFWIDLKTFLGFRECSNFNSVCISSQKFFDFLTRKTGEKLFSSPPPPLRL